jgi:hypothetical protein
MTVRRTVLWLVEGQGNELMDESRVLQSSVSARSTITKWTDTLSLPPVAPSISSIITSTGFEPPTDEPASSTGRIRSSIVLPERASLEWEIKKIIGKFGNKYLALISMTEYPACRATT